MALISFPTQTNYPPDWFHHKQYLWTGLCAFVFTWSHRCIWIEAHFTRIPHHQYIKCRFYRHIVGKWSLQKGPISICSCLAGHHEIFCSASVRLTSGNCSTFAHFQPLVCPTVLTASLHWYCSQCSLWNWSWRYVCPTRSHVCVSCIPLVVQSRSPFMAFFLFFVWLSVCECYHFVAIVRFMKWLNGDGSTLT